MARSFSSAAREAVYAAQTEQVFLILLEIDHDDFADPLRFVNNTESIVYDTYSWLPFPFRVDLPDEKDDTISNAKLTIDNIDQSIITELRALGSPATVKVYIIMAATPSLEAGPFEFTLRNVSYDAYAIRGELVYEDRLNLEFPGLQFTPEYFPGLF
jgi:hypothetical protein